MFIVFLSDAEWLSDILKYNAKILNQLVKMYNLLSAERQYENVTWEKDTNPHNQIH